MSFAAMNKPVEKPVKSRRPQNRHLRPPFQAGNSGNGGRPKGAKDTIPRSFKKFAAALCKDPDWQKRIRVLSEKGNAKAIEAILYYGEGKPVEQVEITGKVTWEQIVKQMRRNDG